MDTKGNIKIQTDLSGTKPTGNRGFARGGLGRKSKRGRNPSNENGYTSKCVICESINHWAANCPDVLFSQDCSPDNSFDDYDHHVTLFQSNLISEESIKVFVSESLSAAILDSGATATVSG